MLVQAMTMTDNLKQDVQLLRPPCKDHPKQAAKREAILTAALELFEQDDFDKVRMIDIARRAGVAKGTLYLYYRTKLDLIEGAIESVVVPAVDEVRALGSVSGGTAYERLSAQVKALGAFFQRRDMRNVIHIILRSDTPDARLRSYFHKRVVMPGEAAFQSVFEAGLKDGSIHPRVKDMPVHVIIGPMVAQIFWDIMFAHVRPMEIEKYMSHVISITLDGVKPENGDRKPA